jgi:protein ImuB
LELAGPVSDLRAVQLGVRHLLTKLLNQLRPRQLGVRRLVLTVKRSDAPPLELTLPLAHASDDEKHLWTLLSPQVERINMGFGVEAMYLSVPDVSALEQTQMPLLPEVLERGSSTRSNRRLGELVDVLASRVGRDGVLAIVPVSSHVPERAFIRQRAEETLARRKSPISNPKFQIGNRKSEISNLLDRPSVILDRPEPIHVTALSPDGPAASFRWKADVHVVQTCLGPERIAPQWWDLRGDSLSTRDYFKLQDQAGRWFWLYRQLRDNRWYIHGFWE